MWNQISEGKKIFNWVAEHSSLEEDNLEQMVGFFPLGWYLLLTRDNEDTRTMATQAACRQTHPYGSGMWGPANVLLLFPFLKKSSVGYHYNKENLVG